METERKYIEVILPKLQTRLAISGDTKSLKAVEHPSGWATERVLWIITPIRLPGWSVVFISSHSRRLTTRHLVLKLLLKDLNSNEKDVLFNLLLVLKGEEYKILEKILSNQIKIKLHLQRVLEEIVRYNFLEIVNPFNELQSYVPRLSIHKIWTEKQTLAPVQYIGVGYKDHGSISPAPSWKDQMTSEGDVSTRLSALLFALDRILDVPLSRFPSSWKQNRLKSSSRAKQG